MASSTETVISDDRDRTSTRTDVRLSCLSAFYLHVNLCLMDMKSGSSCLAIVITNTQTEHQSTYKIAQHCHVNLKVATAGKAYKLTFDL